ncbi:hypothetical protein EVAR_65705_1 [Eumeta japonica]|uniref:Uncharacterized protein n=1 Tax=Eumeta variegata TaxID=151549 RepID=A0A4C2ABK5_EUMVA|nr:hypothetical protein EVAR_65705_1 [Eumeta japonica]
MTRSQNFKKFRFVWSGLKRMRTRKTAHPKRSSNRRRYVVEEYVRAKEVYERSAGCPDDAGSGFAPPRQGEKAGCIYRVIEHWEEPEMRKCPRGKRRGSTLA